MPSKANWRTTGANWRATELQGPALCASAPVAPVYLETGTGAGAADPAGKLPHLPRQQGGLEPPSGSAPPAKIGGLSEK
jgi:hypothetical protein